MAILSLSLSVSQWLIKWNVNEPFEWKKYGDRQADRQTDGHILLFIEQFTMYEEI